jgi:CO/xanthine dehydrogenase Mo-binding subunit
MNKLAEALGIDPVEFRLRNLIEPGEAMPWGRPLPEEAKGLKRTLLETAAALGWQETPTGWTAPSMEPRPGDPSYLKRGVGIALGFKNVGFSFGYQDNAWAAMELFGDTRIEEAVVFVATAEVGQGTYTVIRQMAAEALGIDLEKVRLAPGDTATSQSSGSVSASRMTFMIGNAVRGAAATALEDWKAENRPARGEFTYLAPKTTPIDPQTGYGDPNFSYGYVTIGAEIAVDTQLGTLQCRRLICADDVGQAINPTQVQGQIEGGVIQALGWSTTEHFIQKEGKPLTSTFTTYLMPGIADVPPAVETIIIEEAEPNGPWGARGIAEMPFIPVASALHHALRRTVGVWYNTLPFSAERILRGLKGK